MSERPNQPGAKLPFNVSARLRSFIYAGRGLRWLVQDEHNAWMHLAASVTVVVAGFLLHVSLDDWRWLVFAMSFVWVTEAMNTAVEELCDFVSPGFAHPIGRVKDLAAGAVLAASLAAAVIGLMTLGPPFLQLFR
jgi:diacylglycerol kinase (ATP)